MLIMVAGSTASRITGRSLSQSSYANVRNIQKSITASRSGYTGSGSGGGGSSTTAPTQPQTLTEVTAQTITPTGQAPSQQSSYPNVLSVQKSIITSAYTKAGLQPVKQPVESIFKLAGYQPISLEPSSYNRSIQMSRREDLPSWYEGYNIPATRRSSSAVSPTGISQREAPIVSIARDIRYGGQPISVAQPSVLQAQAQYQRGKERVKELSWGMKTFTPQSSVAEAPSPFTMGGGSIYWDLYPAQKDIYKGMRATGRSNEIMQGIRENFVPYRVEPPSDYVLGFQTNFPFIKSQFQTDVESFIAKGIPQPPYKNSWISQQPIGKSFIESYTKHPIQQVEWFGLGYFGGWALKGGQWGLGAVGGAFPKLRPFTQAVGGKAYGWITGGILGGLYASQVIPEIAGAGKDWQSVLGKELATTTSVLAGGLLGERHATAYFRPRMELETGLQSLSEGKRISPEEARSRQRFKELFKNKEYKSKFFESFAPEGGYKFLSEQYAMTKYVDIGKGSVQGSKGVISYTGGGGSKLTGKISDTRTLIGGEGGGTILPTGETTLNIYAHPPNIPLTESGLPYTSGILIRKFTFTRGKGYFERTPYGFDVVERVIRQKQIGYPKQEFFMKTKIFQQEGKIDFAQLSKTYIVKQPKLFGRNLKIGGKQIFRLSKAKELFPVARELGIKIGTELTKAKSIFEVKETRALPKLFNEKYPSGALRLKPEIIKLEPVQVTKGVLAKKGFSLSNKQYSDLMNEITPKLGKDYVIRQPAKPIRQTLKYNLKLFWNEARTYGFPKAQYYKDMADWYSGKGIFAQKPIEIRFAEGSWGGKYSNPKVWNEIRKQDIAKWRTAGMEDLMKERGFKQPAVEMKQEYVTTLKQAEKSRYEAIPKYTTLMQNVVSQTLRTQTTGRLIMIKPTTITRQKQGLRISNIQKQFQIPRLVQAQTSLLRMTTAQSLKISPSINTRQAVIPKLDIGLASKLLTRVTTTQQQVTRQVTDFGRFTGITPDITTPPPPPLFPESFNAPKGSPIFWGGKKRRRIKHKTRYTPSLSAVILRIKGKGGGGYTSGLEIRPIPA